MEGERARANRAGAERDVLHLAPTERHAEQLLASGLRARSVAAFVGDLASRGTSVAATRTLTRLATGVALQEASLPLAAAVDDALGALRRAGARSDDLVQRGPRARLLASLLEDTDRALASAGRHDPRSAGFRAAEVIAQVPLSTLPSRVVVEGWLDWQAADLAWIEALARRIPVVARIPHVHECEPSLWRDDVLRRLESRWQDATDAPDLEILSVVPAAPEELVEAESDEAEARAIARIVRRALDGGADPERVGVVVTSWGEGFAEALREHLERVRVPYSEPGGRDVLASAVASAALRWVDLLTGPLQKGDLVELLQTSAVQAGPESASAAGSGRTREAPTRDERLLLARALSGAAISTDPDGTLLVDALESDDAKADRASRERELLRGWVARWRADRRSATRPEIADALRVGWSDLGLFETPRATFAQAVAPLEAGERSRTQLSEARAAAASLRESAAAVRGLTSALSDLEEAAALLGRSSELVSLSRFRSEFRLVLSASLGATAPARSPGSVRILSPREAAGGSFDWLLLARSSHSASDEPGGRFLEDEAGLEPTSAPGGAGWNRTIRSLETTYATTGAGAVVLTRSHLDARGRRDTPSSLFAYWRQRGSVRSETATAPDRVLGVSARLGEDERESLTLEDRELTRRVEVERSRLAFFLDPQAGEDERARDRTAAASESRWVDLFGGSRAHPISVTAIERAADCRFAAFARHVLLAEGTEECDESLQPKDRGTLVHRGLLLALAEVGHVPPGHAHPDALERIVQGAVGRARLGLLKRVRSPLRIAEIERALRDVEAVVRWSLGEASRFRYRKGEQRFGGASDAWGPLRLRGGPGDVYVRGTIDRVDVSTDERALRVIDYKTGTAPSQQWLGTRRFQLPLYAEVARREFGSLLTTEVSALYLETGKRPPRPSPGEGAQRLTSERIEAAERAAAETVARLWAGDFAPQPADASLCAHCRVRDICRRPAVVPADEPETSSARAETP